MREKQPEKENERYCLTMTREQLIVTQRACEMYSRILFGQFTEIAYETMMKHIKAEDYCQRREAMEEALLEARKYAFPELYGAGHSLGIGHDHEADVSWNMYQVLRYSRYKHDDPNGGWDVERFRPMDFTGVGMPECSVLADEEQQG